MKSKTKLLGGALAASLLLAGCASMKSMDTNSLLSAGSDMAKAANLSDADIIQLSDAACKQSDQESKIAPAGNKYSVRLTKLMRGFGNMTLNGQKVNYKVYMTEDVNAWAMGNGCVRVYTGLMDLMNDDELRGVIGHEMGHVALGHTKKAMQTAYAVSAARQAAGAAGAAGNSVVASLSASQLGEMTEKFINAQFSQSQETAADDFSFDLLTEKKMNRKGLVTAFQKLAELDGGESSMFSSHPSSPDRAARMEKRLQAGK
ncbi:metalloprotease YggG [Bordetella bronchiseptica MBORD681]|nr:metalloprotease YggG [Bordetella bronchiseptica MBORD681]KDD02470.1 metalloprotease YggG [Bordetella bronchiseptica MBORD698]